MYDFYSDIRMGCERAKRCASRLNGVYSKIPPTKGCMQNLESCGAWCCHMQTPQFLYSEFLHVWHYVSNHFTNDDGADLIERCMTASVDPLPSKGCVFLDKKTNMCMVHKVRPYNCRIYGVTPPEEFNPRYKRLKEEYKSIPGAVIRPQCELVSTENGQLITIEDTNNWWYELVKIERDIGIPKKYINDDQGGSYRSPHDHILLYLMPPNVLNALAGIRMYDDEIRKKMAISDLMSVIRSLFKNE